MASRTSWSLLGVAGLVAVMATAGFVWPGIFRHVGAAPTTDRTVEQKPEALPAAALKLLDLQGSEWEREDPERWNRGDVQRYTHRVQLSIYNGSDYVVHQMEVRVVLRDAGGTTVVDRVFVVGNERLGELAYPKSVGNTTVDVGIGLKEGEEFTTTVLSAVGTKVG